MSVKVRWVHLRDGLRLAIEMLPEEERTLGARLQEHWAYCCRKVERFDAGEVPEWVLPMP